MAITITGAKYASASVSAVGTTTVTVTTTPFLVADFTTQRLVGLWNSAGTTFKGMAWVRRRVSSSQLELVTPFFDPATGATVTQVVGDTVLVSKNFAESVTTGLTVSGTTVNITDGTSITLGTAGSSNSTCFYDEGKYISTNTPMFFAGGLTVFGRLDNYTDNIVSSPCNWYLTASNQVGAIRTSDLAANACIYGGNIDGDRTKTFYIGGNINNLGGGTGGYTLIFNSVQNNFDFTSPSAGGSWGVNAARQQLVNCFSQSTATNAILVRWGDGVITGGSYRFPNYTSSTISVFGSDLAGTYNLATPAGKRAVVLDMGNSRALVRANTAVAVIMNFTNLITTDYRSVTGTAGGLTANPNGTNTFYYNDTYTNLQTGSAVVFLNNSGALVSSSLSTSDTYSPSLLRKTCVGATVTDNATSWTYGFKKYGYLPIGGTITPTTYSLGSAGDADNVAFGGAVIQNVDQGVTLSRAGVAALTTIATANDLYDVTVNWGVSTTGRVTYPSLTAYPAIITGTTIDYGSKTLTLNSAATNAFSINSGTNTVTAKSTTLAGTGKFTTVKATTINILAGSTVTVGLNGAVTNAGVISGAVTGNVTNTGTLGSGTNITGNVSQDTPTNMTGVTISGTLTFNTNTATTITLTNCIIGTIANSGTGAITINMINSSATAGNLVTLQNVITFTNESGGTFSGEVWSFNSTGNLVGTTNFLSLVNSITAYMPLGGSLRVYAQAYGTKPKILNITSTVASQVISLVPETFVDTTLNTTTRNTIVSKLGIDIDVNSRVFLTVSESLAQYLPDEVLNALHYFVVTQGGLISAGALFANTTDGFAIQNGGFLISSPNFYSKVADSVTSGGNLGIAVPLYAQVASSVYTIMPTYTVAVANTSGVVLSYAPWTKAQANITVGDISNITANVWTYNERTLNQALFK